MPRTRECDFCGDDIEPGTGTMFVQNDGSTVMFCSSKCEKNADLGREARDMGWTEAGRAAGGKRAAETADEPETEEEPEDAAATEADVVEDTGAAPDLEDAESEATPGPEGEGAEEAAADADADSTEAVEEDADDEADEDDTEEEEAEA